MSNTNLFAWSVSDMSGINPNFISHKLTIFSYAKHVAQRKRKLDEERKKTMKAKTKKLLKVNFICEVDYTAWLANMVMVKKATGKQRIYVDYTNLKKAYPKDAYPLLSIDKLIDGACGFRLLNFLDTYLGYNQIKMFLLDQEKTTFIIEGANFCYKVMSFGFKNACVTYQRLIDKVFKEQIKKNVKFYVGDMVVKQ